MPDDVDTTSWGLREGDLITPELTAQRRLGGGSAYEAYLAFDEVTLSPVVVKLVRPDQVTDSGTLRGLRREVECLTLVNHPVVVRQLRHVVDGERPHVVLECVDGPRLSSLIRRHGRLSEQQYLPLAVDVAAALHYFRHLDLCHLDIKPSNVIMGAPARLIDLSVARSGARAAALDAPIGTDFYMAPEQCLPGEIGYAGVASDVWGLGATLFHAVAGYRAFDEGDPDAERAEERWPQLVDEPHRLPAGVPAAVAKVLDACLARRAQDRPEPRDVAEALEPVLAAQPVHQLSFKVR